MLQISQQLSLNTLKGQFSMLEAQFCASCKQCLVQNVHGSTEALFLNQEWHAFTITETFVLDSKTLLQWNHAHSMPLARSTELRFEHSELAFERVEGQLLRNL